MLESHKRTKLKSLKLPQFYIKTSSKLHPLPTKKL